MQLYTHLTFQDRSKMYYQVCIGSSMRMIGDSIGRHKSTVSRELKRNKDAIGYLRPQDAHRVAQDRKRQPRVPKVEKIPHFKEYMLEKLKLKWPPKVIAGKWNKGTTNNKQKISAETLYAYCYSKKGQSEGLHKLLPRSKQKRGMKRKQQSNKIGIPDRISISKRPEHINERKEFGHLEADLMFNNESMSANTLSVIERKNRYLSLIKNESKRSQEVIAGLDYVLQRDYKNQIKTITFDNGKEFVLHTQIKEKHRVETFFCHPGSPWEKGSIERANGQVREHIPFKDYASDITQEKLDLVAARLNHMPREILDFSTPCELQRQSLQVEFLTCCTLNLT